MKAFKHNYGFSLYFSQKVKSKSKEQKLKSPHSCHFSLQAETYSSNSNNMDVFVY